MYKNLTFTSKQFGRKSQEVRMTKLVIVIFRNVFFLLCKYIYFCFIPFFIYLEHTFHHNYSTEMTVFFLKWKSWVIAAFIAKKKKDSGTLKEKLEPLPGKKKKKLFFLCYVWLTVLFCCECLAKVDLSCEGSQK